MCRKEMISGHELTVAVIICPRPAYAWGPQHLIIGGRGGHETTTNSEGQLAVNGCWESRFHFSPWYSH